MFPAFVTKPFSVFAHASRRIGFADAAVIAMSRLLVLLSAGRCEFIRFYVFCQPLAQQIFPQRRRPATIAVRRIEAGDAVLTQFPRPAEQIAQRFADGSQCFVAESDGGMLGFMWVHQGVFLDTEVGVRFQTRPQEQTCWDFDVFVSPANRGGLVFFRLWEGACAQLVAQGVRWSVSRVFAHNEDSIRSHARLGAKAIASAVQLRFGSRTVTMADRAPRFHISRGTRCAPLLVADVAAEPRKVYRRFG
jgi:hypothetical protein